MSIHGGATLDSQSKPYTVLSRSSVQPEMLHTHRQDSSLTPSKLGKGRATEQEGAPQRSRTLPHPDALTLAGIPAKARPCLLLLAVGLHGCGRQLQPPERRAIERAGPPLSVEKLCGGISYVGVRR